jgi:tripartite-type tricarboxylate transporter receptor subunit TctC
MRKFLLSLLFVMSPAMATDITVYEMLSKGNPASQITQKWAQALSPGFRVDFRSGLGCAGRDSFVKDRGASLAIVFPGRIWGSLDRGEDTCVVDVTQYKPVAIYEYYNKLCTAADQPYTLKDLFDTTKTLRIGIQPVANPHQYWVDDLNRKYGTQHRTVTAYSNSGEISRGVVAKDVEFGLFSGVTADALIAAGKVRCFATTEPGKPDNFTKVFPRINNLLNLYNGSYIVLANNLTDQQIEELRKIISRVNQEIRDSGTSSLVIPNLDAQGMQQYVNDQITNMLKVTQEMKVQKK